jgi:hypothetical protein
LGSLEGRREASAQENELPILTINRIWRQARKAAFTEEVAASPLAETPYDLRHAAVSTWLNAGISPTQVAEWAGQSPEVLWRNYAKCLHGGQAELRRRVEAGYRTVGKPARLRHVSVQTGGAERTT